MSASALSVQPQPRHPASGEEDRRHSWVHQAIALTLSPYPLSQGILAGHPDAQEAPVWPAPHPSLLTSLALAGRVQVVVGAQQLALAIGPTVIHTWGQEGAQPHFSRCIAAPHEPASIYTPGYLRPGPPQPSPDCAWCCSPRSHPAQRTEGQEPGPRLWEWDSQPGHSGGDTDREKETCQGL